MALDRSSFSGIPLLAAPGRVMTPRPATEALVQRALARVGRRRTRVADVGCGSGAIAVAIALRAPAVEVWATDSCAAAVELARRNVARHGLDARVRVVEGDLLEPVPGAVDLVVANLPYLPERLHGHAAYDDLRSEPPGAVFAPGDGLGPYRCLVRTSGRRLAEHGVLVVQFRRRTLEATRAELGDLLGELEELALAA